VDADENSDQELELVRIITKALKFKIKSSSTVDQLQTNKLWL